MTSLLRNSIIVCVLISPIADAQVEPLDSNEHKRTSVDGLRWHVYDQTSSLPDELALEGILGFVADRRTSTETRRFEVMVLRSQMNLSKRQAKNFRRYLAKIRKQYQRDKIRLEKRMACQSKRSHTGDEIYALFEAMYQAKLALLRQYLFIIQSDLSEDLFARFNTWLERHKLQTTHYTSRHKEAYEAGGVDPDQVLVSVCSRLSMQLPRVN